MEQINRMPRPEGTTFLCRELHKAKSQKAKLERKERLLNHLVNVYTMSGFRINGHSLNLAQFSNLLGVKQEKIQGILFNKAHTMQAFSDPDTLKDTANALAGMCTTWAIQDRGLLQAQVDTLLRAQQGKYKPFITAEVTKALQTLMTSNKNVAEIFKTFYSQGGININMTQTQVKQENALTIDKAYEIVRESTPQIKNVTDHKQAKILSPEMLQEIQENNNLPSPDLLRMYEHLDTSGWEKGKALKDHSPQTRKISSKELQESTTEYIDITEYKAIDQNSDPESESVYIGEQMIQGLQNRPSSMALDYDIESDSGSDQKAIGYGSGSSLQGLQDWDGDRKQPAALEKGFLPGPSQPSSPRAQSLSGTSSTAYRPISTAANINISSNTPGPNKVPRKKKPGTKPHTLYGTKLGCKVPQPSGLEGTQNQDQQGTSTKKPDNLDRHLKAHQRRGTSEPFPASIPDHS